MQLNSDEHAALITLVSEKVGSLYWYAGQCHTDGDMKKWEEYIRKAEFWDGVLKKVES